MSLFDIFLWWLALEIVGLAALPVASHICRNLKDRGYSASKPLGLVLLTYLSWIISYFAGYSYFSVLVSLVIIAACSLMIYRKNGISIDRDYVIRFEILFFLAFLVFAIIRAYSPEIYWTGGEKLMDITFINSLLRTTQFPPLDPWMSGTVIYYYYFGYLIVADLIKLTGIIPSIAFNLATASFFALSTTTAFGIGYNLTERIKYGIITAFFVTAAGNLVGFFQLMYILFIQKGDPFSFFYWTGSRVIPDTINEFPFFSFLQGDVHAHMISITFQLLIILLLLNVMKSGTQGLISILILSLSIGFLYPLNTWDYPVYLALAIVVIVSRFFLSNSRELKNKEPQSGFANQVSAFINAETLRVLDSAHTYALRGIRGHALQRRDSGRLHLRFTSGKELVKPIATAGTVAVSSYLLYFPYHVLYKIERTISPVISGRTSLVFYLAIYGAMLYLLYSFVILKSKKYDLKPIYFTVSVILLSIVVLAVALIAVMELKSFVLDNVGNPKINEFELRILLIPLLILSLISIFREKDENHVFVLILMITGILLSLSCELFYVRDALGSANPALVRLNTVFKLYLQNWILWGVAAGYVVFQFRDSFARKKIWGVAAIILVLMVSVYPVFATIGKSGSFRGEPTLDGEAYVRKEHPQEYMAILWFRNISGQPVVLQAQGDLYQWNTYITAFTGLPTVAGWTGHELNWRFPSHNEIDARWSDVHTMYTSSNIDEIDALLKKYNVSYIYFGEAERKRYRSSQPFDARPERFEKVFEYGDVAVYKVRPNR